MQPAVHAGKCSLVAMMHLNASGMSSRAKTIALILARLLASRQQMHTDSGSECTRSLSGWMHSLNA